MPDGPCALLHLVWLPHTASNHLVVEVKHDVHEKVDDVLDLDLEEPAAAAASMGEPSGCPSPEDQALLAELRG